ncbi:hypothetical protein Cni_G09232 [Canna indica]|uniref:Uncharacterized protein n=1 Tax=Canna indica TaxID=4628 RepID=A0AAQ3K1W9_9LILI|nr:hypothetical protein Cni_G09232 [Canna indica]
MAMIAEGIDKEVQRGLITEAVLGGGAIESFEGVSDEVGCGKAVEENAEGGAEEVGRGEWVGGDEGPGEGELKVLAEDVDGPSEGSSGVGGSACSGGGGGPAEEIEGVLPVVGVTGKSF